MAQVLIRNIEDDVLERLKKKAADRGLSLEAYLRTVVTENAGPSHAEIISEIDKIRQSVRPWQPGDATAEEIVREMRDERTRVIARRMGLEE
ncbi:MAG: hypothetical protein ABUS57_05125 [Pseudomonadota bacterium]